MKKNLAVADIVYRIVRSLVDGHTRYEGISDCRQCRDTGGVSWPSLQASLIGSRADVALTDADISDGLCDWSPMESPVTGRTSLENLENDITSLATKAHVTV